MDTCTQAEAFRLLLLMGVVSKLEVIAWADSVIATDVEPANWLLDVSLAANESENAVEQKLRELPCGCSPVDAAYSAVTRLEHDFRTGLLDAGQTARMLQRWAASAKVDQNNWTMAMVPIWVADEVEFGYTTMQDVADAVDKSFEHFEAVRRAG